jgi:hypothetical protein
MDMNGYGRLGFVVGMLLCIIITLVVCFVLLSILNTDRRAKTVYYERQQMVRGKGYKYSFYTIIGLLVLLITFDVGDIQLPIKHSVLYFCVIVVGIMVHTTYCIFNDGYFGLNNPPKLYYISFIVIGLMNVLIGILNGLKTGFTDDGMLDTPVINFLCGMMFVVLGISILIKKLMVKDDIDDEDEDGEDEYYDDYINNKNGKNVSNSVSLSDKIEDNKKYNKKSNKKNKGGR